MAAKPKKYARVVEHLPKYPGEDQKRQAVIDQVKTEIMAPANETDPPVSLLEMNLQEADDCVDNIVAIVKRMTRGNQQAATFTVAYLEMRRIKEKAASWISSVQLLLDTYEQMMLASFEADHITSMRLADGGGVNTRSEPCGKVVDKEAFRQWCVKNGYEQKLQLWPSTMNEVVKERTLNAEAPPDGVEVYVRTIVSLARG